MLGNVIISLIVPTIQMKEIVRQPVPLEVTSVLTSSVFPLTGSVMEMQTVKMNLMNTSIVVRRLVQELDSCVNNLLKITCKICFELTDSECTKDSFRCLTHHCIASFLVCNGVADCTDNSDEFECDARTSSTTLPPNRSFNNDDGSEGDSGDDDPNEFSLLKNNEPCPVDKFTCDTGECLEYTKVCDKSNDCIDGSDEGPGKNPF